MITLDAESYKAKIYLASKAGHISLGYVRNDDFTPVYQEVTPSDKYIIFMTKL
jgi:hypothetical protein